MNDGSSNKYLNRQTNLGNYQHFVKQNRLSSNTMNAIRQTKWLSSNTMNEIVKQIPESSNKWSFNRQTNPANRQTNSTVERNRQTNHRSNQTNSFDFKRIPFDEFVVGGVNDLRPYCRRKQSIQNSLKCNFRIVIRSAEILSDFLAISRNTTLYGRRKSSARSSIFW